MINEGEFNAYLSKEFKKLPDIKAVKLSDRFKIGLPDWIIFKEGRAAVFECKFVKSIDPKKKVVLSHKISPMQIATLKSFRRVNVPSWVLIYVNDKSSMFLGHILEVLESGNIDRMVLQNHFPAFKKNDITSLVRYLFWENEDLDEESDIIDA